jgi:hypothetical protein
MGNSQKSLTLLDQLCILIELQKQHSKPGWHDHEGSLPTHPVRVKDHPKYFSTHTAPPGTQPKLPEGPTETFQNKFQKNGDINAGNVDEFIKNAPVGTFISGSAFSHHILNYRKEKDGWRFLYEDGTPHPKLQDAALARDIKNGMLLQDTQIQYPKGDPPTASESLENTKTQEHAEGDSLSNHSDPLIRDTHMKAMESISSDSEHDDMLSFAKRVGIQEQFENMQNVGEIWSDGPAGVYNAGLSYSVSMRAAINTLKGTAKSTKDLEEEYFVATLGVSKQKFADEYEKGVHNAVGLLPYVAKTQKILKNQYPSGKVTVYRGIWGDPAKDIRDARKKAIQTKSSISIPQSGVSSYTLDWATAEMFASSGMEHGIIMSKHIPISAIWVAMNSMNDIYPDQEEILINTDHISSFTPDEIEEINEI